MLSHHEKQSVINILNDVIGVGTSMKNDEQAHHCPFCHHHKKKLQINLQTQQWHCWVCDSKGKKIQSLLRKLHTDSHKFKSLLKEPSGFTPMFRKVTEYAKARGITKEDIIRYNIGYCKSGIYGGRIIIPSYDANNRLNYFIARSVFEEEKFKYKNPPVSKDVIMFENQINWLEPITLVEGVFDAMAVKRNAIPLLGKFIPKKLNDSIYKQGVSKINILLDEDAQQQALRYTMQLQNQGITTRNIIPSEKDAGEMGFSQINTILKESKRTEFSDIISQKLNNL